MFICRGGVSPPESRAVGTGDPSPTEIKLQFKNEDRVPNALFGSFFSVLVNGKLILGTVGKTRRAADTAVYASHTLYKVFASHALLSFQQSRTAVVYAVADRCFQLERLLRYLHFFKRVCDRV